jgi:tRNA(Ile)-lysidine synthetase-like protein
MIKIQGKIPTEVGVAVSGGVDSMAVLDFLRRNHDVTAYYFDHGTEYGLRAGELVREYCGKHDVPLRYGVISQIEKPKKKSLEEHWRDERYAWFKAQPQEIVMAHHLDDCVEEWVFRACHGDNPRSIAYRHANVFRPFRWNRKHEFINWAERHSVPWLDDPGNGTAGLGHVRTYIRLVLLPAMLRVNPGLHTVVKKSMLNIE